MTGKIEIQIESEMNHENIADQNQDTRQLPKSYQNETEKV